MEDQKELTPKEREEYFKMELRDADPAIQDRYHTLLLDEQAKKIKERHGKPPEQVSLETKENFLRIAKITRDIEAARSALKMEKDWEKASRGGRPPIGGAVDD